MRLKGFTPAIGAIVGIVSGGYAVAGGLQGPPPPPPLGGPIAGLTPTEHQAFDAGLANFIENEGPQDGLGPVFNGTSCGECHHAAALGGASPNLTVSRVTRIGAIVKGQYSDLAEFGGPLLQARSLRELIPRYPVSGEVVPRAAQFVAHRITTPLFGAGLLEAVPDAEIIALAKQRRGDGVQGTPNMVFNPETQKIEVGRFGWKAQHSSLHIFAADAYLNEMGITNPLFPTENLPQGKPIPPGADLAADPEDQGGDVDGLTTFMRFLAPPAHLPVRSVRGQELFASIGCISCHVASLETGAASSPALAKKVIWPYTDLLLHRMGSGLADNIRQGLAQGDQFRTAPLWGVARRPFLLHDGRATTIDQAIRLHGGEATSASSRYQSLSLIDRQSLLSFLSGL